MKQPAVCAGVLPCPYAAGTCGCRSQHIPSELCGPSSENRSGNREGKGRFLKEIAAKQHCLWDREQWKYPSCLLVDAPKDVGIYSRFIFCTYVISTVTTGAMAPDRDQFSFSWALGKPQQLGSLFSLCIYSVGVS